MTKKAFALLLSTVLAACVLTGCQDTKEIASPIVTEESASQSDKTSLQTEPAASSETSVSETSASESATSETAKESQSEKSAKPVVENHDNMYRSELTNEWIGNALKSQRPVAVMVDNEVTALDHYGLTQADIVYEMMNSTANGEVTRLMAIVKDWGSITRFGSIRSVRPTNFMIAPEYNAVLVHDGGPFYINEYLTNPWVNNLSGGFARINNGKAREFTEYVTTGEIASRMKSAGYSTEYNSYYQGQHWQFADETAPVDLSSVYNVKDCTLVDLPFPHNSSELKYDEGSGTYLYYEYGRAHIDPENDDKQLAFTNVILQRADVTELDANGYMKFNILNQTGSGYYITGGKAIPVTWEKNDAVDPTKFYDSNGTEITLNTGRTYIALVSSTRWNELVLK
ncbi:MAG: DUF3048 domain-containing protein [Lachnospiraceae bacterium]|nr:DUF3048 domain-containing protein [Lachnospiraceae bacterium]